MTKTPDIREAWVPGTWALVLAAGDGIVPTGSVKLPGATNVLSGPFGEVMANSIVPEASDPRHRELAAS